MNINVVPNTRIGPDVLRVYSIATQFTELHVSAFDDPVSPVNGCHIVALGRCNERCGSRSKHHSAFKVHFCQPDCPMCWE